MHTLHLSEGILSSDIMDIGILVVKDLLYFQDEVLTNAMHSCASLLCFLMFFIHELNVKELCSSLGNGSYITAISALDQVHVTSFVVSKDIISKHML
jgi:hypothetical protein